MTNKIITFIVAAIFCFGSTVFAEKAAPCVEYGAKSYENDFNMTKDSDLSAYPYFIKNADASVSTTEKRSGQSISLDISSQKVNTVTEVSFSFHDSETQPANNCYYVEGYVKGFDTLPDTFIPCYTYNSGSAPALKYGNEKVDNGWIRVWYVVPVLDSYLIDGHSGWSYTIDNKSPDILYFDDFSIRPIPREIVLQDRSCLNSSDFDLTQIYAWGYSDLGERRNIVNKKDIKWNIKSGNAIVLDNMLKFTDTEAQEIELEADFYGIVGDVKLQADKYSGFVE